MSERPKSAIPKYRATAKERQTTTVVDFIVASRVGHCTRLNSAMTSLKNCRILLNIIRFAIELETF
uniref:Uncharacterized protein n=1 Tax=uncultured marine microorganism HF4000_APKG2K17 TaxID=455547 RepID=B3T6R1_9ZZZZ|nr:hypothetical protein ALOHA_HF4000APKG2K17ctg1g27 [uncultured marine microorganism HF4000_APKG2K17]